MVCQEYEDECVALINEIHENVERRGLEVDCYILNGLWPEELEEQRRRRFRRRVRRQLATAQQLYSNRQPCFSFANTFYPLFLRVLLLNAILTISTEAIGRFVGRVQDEFIPDEDGMSVFDDQDDSVPNLSEAEGETGSEDVPYLSAEEDNVAVDSLLEEQPGRRRRSSTLLRQKACWLL